MFAGENNIAYDPRRHITAGELRGLGFLIGEMIPDGAFVRRVAVDLDPAEDIGDGTATLGLKLYEPFAMQQECLAAVA